MPTRYNKEFKQNIINLYKQGESAYIQTNHYTAHKIFSYFLPALIYICSSKLTVYIYISSQLYIPFDQYTYCLASNK